MLARAHQHDRDREIVLGERRWLEADKRSQMLETVLLSAVIESGRLAADMHRDLGFRKTQHSLHCGKWQCVELLPRADNKCMADRKRERQTDGKTCALAFGGLHVQRATELLDFARHDIHADA